MSTRSGAELSGEWAAFVAAMDPAQFKTRLARALSIAQARIGREFVAMARREIAAGGYAPNSPITRAIKGSTRPLVDRGDLVQSLTFQVVDPYTVRLGIMRAKSGEQQVNIGAVLHEGATIDVKAHPGVRAAVWAKVREAVGADRLAALTGKRKAVVKAAAGELGLRAGRHPWTPRQRAWWFATHPTTPAGTGKAVWVIPPRPFIMKPVSSAAFKAMVLKHYGEAVRAAFGDRS